VSVTPAYTAGRGQVAPFAATAVYMNPAAWRLRALRNLQSGQFASGLRVLDEWISQRPDEFEPQFLRIQMLLQCGQVRDAADAAMAISAAADCPPEMAAEFVRCLRHFSAHDALIDWSLKYHARAAVPTGDIAQIAADFAAVGAHDAASDWIETAIASDPDSSSARIGRAFINVYFGKVDAATRDLMVATRVKEAQPIGYWLLTRLQRQTGKRNHLLAIRKALNAATRPQDRAYLGYALFKTYDDLGEHDAAWNALMLASSASAQFQPRIDDDTVFAAVRRSVEMPVAQGTAGERVTPVFVVGMHRSGTTLVERMLGGSPQVRTLGETRRLAAAITYAADRDGDGLRDPDIINAACAADPGIIARHFALLAQQQSAPADFVTEKSPDNFLAIGFIRAAMPEAKIVHVRREPVDLCFANMREFFQAGVPYRCRMDTLAHFHRAYSALMEFWRQSFPGFVLDVDYESLVNDPDGESKRIFDFCGIEWLPSVTAVEQRPHVPSTTLSAIQVRSPVHGNSVGRWRPYAHYLRPLIESLAEPV